MAARPIPEGYRTLTPYFSVRRADKFIEFLKAAFDATVNFVIKGPGSTVMSSEILVGDSLVMVGEDDAEESSQMRAMLYMYVKDVDAVYKKAIRAGAKSIMEVEDQFWGDRTGVVQDKAGNQWWIATHKEDLDAEEIVKRGEMQQAPVNSKPGSPPAEAFRRLALSMKDAVEGEHMAHPDFRVNGKIFATIHGDHKWGMVALTPDQQQGFVRENPKTFAPEAGAWGRAGSTKVRLDNVDEDTLGKAMTLAWQNKAAKSVPKARTKRKRAGD
jgi:PhnB protein